MYSIRPLLRVTLAGLAMLLSCMPSAIGAYVDPVTGREWRNPAEVKGFSWNAIDLVCPNDGTTACNGSITPGTADDVLSGWIWGTHAQVIDLFKHVTGLGAALDDGGELEPNADWGGYAALLGLTQSSETVDPQAGLYFYASSGWVAESYDVNGTLYGRTDTIAYCEPSSIYPQSGPCHPFRSYVNDSITQDSQASYADPDLGTWLFRPAQVTAVPEPNTLYLLFAAVLVMASLQLRRSNARRKF